ncbi:MAG: PglZ domain-containing protein [Proteiniphilum sp.]|nr:PglZ domain-containing protein [Proteiniphilum sp.]
MDEFIHRLEQRLTGEGKRLSIVKNPDGFLQRPDTQQAVFNACGLLLLPISSSLELRVRYELYDKNTHKRICYIMDDPASVLPDLKQLLYKARTFSIPNLMPACNETEIRQARLTFGMASYIYNKKFVYDLSPVQTKEVIEEAKKRYGEDINELITKLKSIPLKWEKVETMDSICHILLKAISQGVYDKMETAVEIINEHFQQYIAEKYFALFSSSHIAKPKTVNKILPYLAYKHSRTEKVALVVIDGITFWQYLILDKKLTELGIKTKKDVTMAWIPTITKLSRQAIFRGNIPQQNYEQNPIAEERLWSEFWINQNRSSKRMQPYEISYTHDSLLTHDTLRCKQAFVDVSLDRKMHSSSSNKDLYDLTENWAEEAAESIQLLHEQKFTIYITADHGNIMAHSWRALNSQERTFLYEKESRGSRHLIYSNATYLDNFIQNNPEIHKELLVHDNWAVWKNSRCFKGKDEITHGGSHFLEVIIPFVTIEKD